MNDYRQIMSIERQRTANYALGVPDADTMTCPICGSRICDYLVRDTSGELVGCDDCIRREYESGGDLCG